MSVIFTDHFGCLCLADKHGVEHSKFDLPNVNQMRIHGSFEDFNTQAVKILNEIILLTDCEIVISSDWKKWCSLDEMKEFYKLQGIVKCPIDYTPNLNLKNIFENRSEEIKSWLSTHKVTKWVAVDDIYLGDYLSNFVWISKTDEGIAQKGIYDKILSFIL